MGNENEANHRYSLTIDSDFREIEKINDLITHIAEEEGINEDTTCALRISLEEMVCNSIMHGFKNKKTENAIEINLYVTPESVRTDIMDHAPAFNPVEAPSPDLSIPFEEREPGGMGIHLTRNLMDKFTYEYSEGRNIITLEKDLTGLKNHEKN